MRTIQIAYILVSIIWMVSVTTRPFYDLKYGLVFYSDHQSNNWLVRYWDPDVNIFTFQLLEIIEVGLEGQEYVSLLSWMIQTYPGQDLMKSPSLGIPPEKIKPLLDQKVIDDLQVKYLKVCVLEINLNF